MNSKNEEAISIERIDVSAYRVPTDLPESDGTLEWDSTTIVIVEASAAGATGIGYTYSSTSAAKLIKDKLGRVVEGQNAMNVPEAWQAMVHSIRNLGRPGIASTAIAALDIALWDLKAHLLGVPLSTLFGSARKNIPVYGSGGFTSYTIEQLQKQLSGWVEQGIPRVKMKVGREPEKDLRRVRAAREAIGPDAQLFVDANGAYSRKQALAFADVFSDFGVTWFEEPVSSDDLEGLRLIRDRAPSGIDITAGEYGYDLFYFQRMLDAGAVDVLQADVTRCAGMTEFLRVGALCQAQPVPLSAHTAPTLHVHVCSSLPVVRHLEYFHDHVRIERIFFNGAPEPRNGVLQPNLTRPGMGLELRRADVEQYRASI